MSAPNPTLKGVTFRPVDHTPQSAMSDEARLAYGAVIAGKIAATAQGKGTRTESNGTAIATHTRRMVHTGGKYTRPQSVNALLNAEKRKQARSKGIADAVQDILGPVRASHNKSVQRSTRRISRLSQAMTLDQAVVAYATELIAEHGDSQTVRETKQRKIRERARALSDLELGIIGTVPEPASQYYVREERINSNGEKGIVAIESESVEMRLPKLPDTADGRYLKQAWLTVQRMIQASQFAPIPTVRFAATDATLEPSPRYDPYQSPAVPFARGSWSLPHGVDRHALIARYPHTDMAVTATIPAPFLQSIPDMLTAYRAYAPYHVERNKDGELTSQWLTRVTTESVSPTWPSVPDVPLKVRTKIQRKEFVYAVSAKLLRLGTNVAVWQLASGLASADGETLKSLDTTLRSLSSDRTLPRATCYVDTLTDARCIVRTVLYSALARYANGLSAAHVVTRETLDIAYATVNLALQSRTAALSESLTELRKLYRAVTKREHIGVSDRVVTTGTGFSVNTANTADKLKSDRHAKFVSDEIKAESRRLRRGKTSLAVTLRDNPYYRLSRPWLNREDAPTPDVMDTSMQRLARDNKPRVRMDCPMPGVRIDRNAMDITVTMRIAGQHRGTFAPGGSTCQNELGCDPVSGASTPMVNRRVNLAIEHARLANVRAWVGSRNKDNPWRNQTIRPLAKLVNASMAVSRQLAMTATN